MSPRPSTCACFLFVILAACDGGGGSPAGTPGNPVAGAGQFEMHCATCHPDGEEETGPALRDRRLSPAYVRKWIRQGSERMTPISPEQLSDDDMRDLISFMATLGAVED